MLHRHVALNKWGPLVNMCDAAIFVFVSCTRLEERLETMLSSILSYFLFYLHLPLPQLTTTVMADKNNVGLTHSFMYALGRKKLKKF